MSRGDKRYMSIQRAEELKREWTDRQVTVAGGVPELRRFSGLVGRVRTVNMNCRLLVEFNSSADIGWYDIDPQFVRAVIAKKATAEKTTVETTTNAAAGQHSSDTATTSTAIRPAATETTAPVSTAAADTRLSPLDQIRARAAAGRSPAASAPPVGSAAGSGKSTPLSAPQRTLDVSGSEILKSTAPAASELSPLEQIRARAHASPKSTTPKSTTPETPATQKPAELTSASTSESGNAGDARPESTSVAIQPATSGTPNKATPPRPIPPATIPPATFPAAVPNPVLQIRQQAAASDPGAAATSPETASVFDRIRQQASASESSPALPSASTETQASQPNTLFPGIENPVQSTFRGKKLPKQDDLTIVEGIGPKISELFHQNGIDTWRRLADAAPEHLRTILDDAGPR
ncbi:MAG: hypothetical protein KDA89_20485, partial [Planctomycetaceae bacterium]|nr:hypothetical protein [Planctomycetaceae bacterium]